MSQTDLFMEVRDYLIEEIIANKFGDVGKLPSEHQLAEMFGMSRSQIRNVFQQLTELGYIEAQQGVGYFVKKPLPDIHLILSGEQSFSDKMKQASVNYHARQTLVLMDREYYIFQRVRYIDNIPIAIHTSYLPVNLFPNFVKDIGDETSLFAYLRRQGYHSFVSGETTIQMTIATQKEQRLLECGSLVPIILLKSSCINADSQQVLEYSKTLYRGDIIKFKLDL